MPRAITAGCAAGLLILALDAAGPVHGDPVWRFRFAPPLNPALTYHVDFQGELVVRGYPMDGDVAVDVTMTEDEDSSADSLRMTVCFDHLSSNFDNWPRLDDGTCVHTMISPRGEILWIDLSPLSTAGWFMSRVLESLLPLLPARPVVVGSKFEVPYTQVTYDRRWRPITIEGTYECTLDELKGKPGEEAARFYGKAFEKGEQEGERVEVTTEHEATVAVNDGHVLRCLVRHSFKGRSSDGTQYGMAFWVRAKAEER